MIVTGFVDLEPYEDRARGKTTQGYIDNARWLIGSDVPMIVFVESRHRESFERLRPKGSFTIWETAEVPPYDERLETSRCDTWFRWNPVKDTPRYFGLMRQKIAWLRRGAEILAKGVATWVDIGLSPGADYSPTLFFEGGVSKIRLAELSHVPRSVRHDRALFYRDHYWPVAGGIIHGSVEDLVWLDERVEEEWRWCLEHSFVATDEMMLGYIRFQHPERFSVYYADHPTLVQNWKRPEKSHRLILHGALRALEDGCEAEAKARVEAVCSVSS